MTHCYRHLSAEDRSAIMLMRVNHSIRAIARQLERAPSTVLRELVRHTVRPEERMTPASLDTEPDCAAVGLAVAQSSLSRYSCL